MNIIGIDLSLAGTGMSRVGSSWTIKTKEADQDGRLVQIYNVIRSEVSNLVDLAVLEDLPVHAMAAGITGRVQGIARLALIQENVPYITVDPSSLKKFATGSGAAKKPQMKESVNETDSEGWDDNAVDAYWCRQFGLYANFLRQAPHGEYPYKYKRYDSTGRRFNK